MKKKARYEKEFEKCGDVKLFHHFFPESVLFMKTKKGVF